MQEENDDKMLEKTAVGFFFVFCIKKQSNSLNVNVIDFTKTKNSAIKILIRKNANRFEGILKLSYF